MNYTLHQLQVFLKVTQVSSITKAANDLNLTQPAVSIQLKNFLNQFDIPLIEIIGKKLYVTDFGLEIAHAAENILNEVYAINYKTMAFKGKLAGRLKISVVSTGKYLMPYLLTDFLSANQGVELYMDVTDKSRVVESLEENEVDFALMSVKPKNISLLSEPIMTNHLVVACRHDLVSDGDHRDTDIFNSYPMIHREDGSATRQESELFFQRNNLKINKKIVLTSNEAVKQAVMAGLGISIIPLLGIKNEINSGELKILPIKGFPIRNKWELVRLKDKQLSPVADGFLEYIKKHKTDIIQKHFAWISDVYS